VTRYVRLSHDITVDGPGFPGMPRYAYRPFTSMDRGDAADTYDLVLFNHFGTHIDAPNHFNPAGAKITEVPIERFVYEQPLLIEITTGDRQLVSRDEIAGYDRQLRDSDALFIRSGWGQLRDTDPKRYIEEGPGIASAACEYLIGEHPNLKAVGFDWISLSAYHHLAPEGIRAHQLLAGVHQSDRYVLVIEDLKLDDAGDALERVFALPLFPEGVDSSPCTVVAEVR
jgi:arylformamidase